MKTRQKIVYGILAIIFALTFAACDALLGSGVDPDKGGTGGTGGDGGGTPGLSYELMTDGYRVRSGTVENGAVVIPANYNGKPVISIGNSAFSYLSITSISIPASVTSIGDYAFNFCTSLTTVTFAAGSRLTTIGQAAFAECKSLTGIEIPANVMSIGTINPDGGPMGAFEGCENLKIVTFESGSKLETIGSFAFADCISLTSIEIPASVTSIGGCAFSSRFFDHHLYSLKTVTFAPNSRLKDIGVRTFEYTGLTSIIIPANVTSIGSGAFSFCADLETVTFEAGSKLETIGYMAFFDCNSISAITIPAGVTSIGDHAFSSCESLSSAIAIPSGVTSINNSSFSGTRISAITIPSGVTSIGDYAFLECIDLKTVTFETGSKLETIGDKAFRRCTSISAITIPAGVTSIGKSAFDSWTASQTINIPFANQAAADAAWGEGWRNICFATINYNG